MHRLCLFLLTLVAWVSLACLTGCAKRAVPTNVGVIPARHEHHPPHGGTPVVLGEEAYHLELVLDSASGTLQADVLDGEMEDFVRCAAPALEVDVREGGQSKTLTLSPVANPATGETVSDTALFEAHVDWLKSAKDFDGTLKKITIRGTTFTDVKFNFPKGNDRD